MAFDGTGLFFLRKTLFAFLPSKDQFQPVRSPTQLQMLGAALVHPELKEVIPLIPEIISRQDGYQKRL